MPVTVAALLAGGCSSPGAREAAPARSAPAGSPAPERQALTQSAADIRRTIESMRRLDDLPLYEMTFHGSYDPEAPVTEESLAAPAGDWACSLFFLPATGPGDRPLFGRNFDWDPHPAMAVHADPPGGYASVSMVDLFYVLGSAAPPDPADPGPAAGWPTPCSHPSTGSTRRGWPSGWRRPPTGSFRRRRPTGRTSEACGSSG
nr:hypothetical protein GCM10020093_027390 [Planobispora longispora]